MPLTRSDIPELLLPGLKAEFATAYRSELDHSVADQIATTISTTLPVQKYAWLGATPPMREFTDERRPAGLASHATSIEDKVFESTIVVDRKAIEDDQLDLIRLRVRDLAFRVASHRHQMVIDALNRGNAELGYDGKALFATDHPTVPGETAGNVTDDGLSQVALAQAMSAMMAVLDDSGTPLGVTPDTLLVGPSLMWDAIELIESPVVVYKGTGTAGTSPTPYGNAFQGRLKLVVSPFITGSHSSRWYLLDTKRPIRSVILQQRSDVPIEFTALEQGAGETAFLRDRFYYGVRGRYNVGYGLWQTAYAGGVA